MTAWTAEYDAWFVAVTEERSPEVRASDRTTRKERRGHRFCAQSVEFLRFMRSDGRESAADP